MPGVTMIGTEDKLMPLVESARKEGVDFLIVFNVDVRLANGIIQNNTKVELIDVATGKQLKDVPATQQLLNTRVAKEMDEKRNNPVQNEVRRLFKAIDDKVQLTELPSTATPEKLEPFVDKLLEAKHANAIPVMAQLRYYYHKKLINGDRYVSGCAKLIGDEKAKIVAEGNQEKMLTALATFLPKERPPSK